VQITGLLRMSEPKARVLRADEPAPGRWYSRDVQAIGQRRGLTRLAPYFIDADASASAGGWPLGALTVVAFPNNHLVHALTWFGWYYSALGGPSWGGGQTGALPANDPAAARDRAERSEALRVRPDLGAAVLSGAAVLAWRNRH
jgi:surfeit locus 1 family protein